MRDVEPMAFRVLTGFGSRLRGLIGREAGWLAGYKGVVLVPCRSIHTFGMRQSIDVAFVDSTGRVCAVERGLASGKVRAAEGSVMVIERYASTDPWFDVGFQVFCIPRSAGGEGRL